MRFSLSLIAIAFFCISLMLWNFLSTNKSSHIIPTNQDKFLEREEDDAADERSEFEGAANYEFNMTKDPNGKIPPGIHEKELQQAATIFSNQSALRTLSNNYSFVGPGNLGGRTRSIVYDVDFANNQTIYASGVSGGLYKSVDNAATWVRKSPINNLFSVTTIAQDPRPGMGNILYYGTGEIFNGNSAAAVGALYLGNGVYKSTDRGESWQRLTESNTGVLEVFDNRADFITKLVVNPVNGDVYMACISSIFRSQNGGSTWTNVLNGAFQSASQLTDIIVTPSGRLYAAFAGSNSTSVDGVWTSTTGNSGGWTRIAGTGVGINPAGWNAAGSYGRMVLAATPQKDSVYAIYDNGVTSTCPSGVTEAELFRYDLSENSWTDLSANLPDEPGCSLGNDPFTSQKGYDLVMSVKPDADSVLFIGGSNIYRSNNAFSNTNATTRMGGYNSTANFASYANSHPDIHAIAFQPNNPNIMLCGNDGGIQRTLNDTATSVSWLPTNTDLRTFQYYYVTEDPRVGNNKVLGGAQDNGTSRNINGNGSDFELVRTGDGVSVGLSNLTGGNTFEYCGSQNGAINRRFSTSSLNAVTDIRPSSATNNGLFITLFHLDPDNTEIIYYANDSSLYRSVSASTTNTTLTPATSWTLLSNVGPAVGSGSSKVISALATTRGVYNAATASLFIGTSNGRVYRIDDPSHATADVIPLNISGASFPTAGYIRSISVNPRNDDTVLVTFSNYGVVGLWWTGNANATSPVWQNVEGNLTLPSVRSSVIALTSTGVDYFVGTSVGLFRTSINGGTPGSTTWTQEGSTDIGNAVVNSLALRVSDNTMLVGTHGYGMWRTALTNVIVPLHFISFTGKAEGTFNRLLWVTDNEFGNSGFELERKYSDENNFTSIGFVKTINDNAVQHNYAFEDQLVDLGKQGAAYRLKQIDLNGKFTYSSTITINRNPALKLIEYISLFSNELFIRVNNGNSLETMRVQLLDATGRLLRTYNVAQQTQQININNVPSGVYIVTISNQHGYRFSQQVFK